MPLLAVGFVSVLLLAYNNCWPTVPLYPYHRPPPQHAHFHSGGVGISGLEKWSFLEGDTVCVLSEPLLCKSSPNFLVGCVPISSGLELLPPAWVHGDLLLNWALDSLS